jgi:hypothetical protein
MNGTLTDRVDLTINLDQGAKFRRHFKWEQSIDTCIWYCFRSRPGLNKYERAPTYDANTLDEILHWMKYLRTLYVGSTTPYAGSTALRTLYSGREEAT